ncbi:hypothetical protein GE061_012746 [Apolygus lucorum]|uniref:Reverse transcriptase domain-containing protein n=1 Tax=Apolygus lucorum TaxID=248454 RepID=A0A8S9XX85_APOLU|nr:hypothetical protein GE061_012746 [Apolygus lucorum]
MLGEALSSVKNKMPADTPLLVMGDFNCRIGFGNEAEEPLVLGSNLSSSRNSLDAKLNKRGRLFLELCEDQSLLVCNGRSQCDKNGEYTFISRMGKSVVDLALVNLNCLNIFTDFTVGDFSQSSDHLPCIASLQMSSHSYNENCNDPRKNHFRSISTNRLDDNQKDLFRMEISYVEWLVDDQDLDMERIFLDFVRGIWEAAEKAGMIKNPPKSPNHTQNNKPWFTTICREKRYLVRKAYRKLRRSGYKPEYLQNYLLAKVNYNQAKTQAEQDYTSKIVTAINNCHNSRDFWDAIRRLKWKPWVDNPIRLETWVEFYGSFYSGNYSLTVELSLDAFNPIFDREFTLQEVLDVIKTLRRSKAPGWDGIPNEIFQMLPESWMLQCVKFFNRTLNTGIIPKSWGRTKLRLLYKKGDKLDPSNYRALALIPTMVKIFTSLIAKRLSNWAEENNVLPEEQNGFRPGRSCVDQVFTLQSLACVYNARMKTSVLCTMVDLRRAFDSLEHYLIWDKLVKLGISIRLICVLRNLYRTATFILEDPKTHETAEQKITKGVLQGDSLSPLCFILFLADLGKYMEESGCSGLRLGGRELLYLAFADDLAIFGDCASDMQRKMTAFEAYYDENQLQINTLKTKVIVLGRRGRRRKMPITIGGERLEYVSTFTYLGVPISSSLRFKAASEHFISRSRSAVGATLDLMKRGSVVTWSTKNSLFVSSVESVLFYAVELWGLRYLNSLEVVQSGFLKSALFLPRSTPGHYLRMETCRPRLCVQVLKRTLNFYKRMLKMKEERWPRICLALLQGLDGSESNLPLLNWVSQLHDLLCVVGEAEVAHLSNVDLLCSRFGDVMEKWQNHWLSVDIELCLNSRYNEYFRSICTFGEPETYLGNMGSLEEERVVAQLRLSHSGRLLFYTGGLKYAIDCTENCMNCNRNEAETVIHFLFLCPLYKPYRNFYLAPLIPNYSATDTLPLLSTFETLEHLLALGSPASYRAIQNYIVHSLRLRSFSLNE